MYIYFDKLDACITCDPYPSIISVEVMKKHNLQYLCNQWIKTTNEDNSFHLSFNYSGDLVQEGCIIKNGTNLYLQNSGCMDILIAGENCETFNLCEDNDYPNVYRYVNSIHKKDNKFAIHCESHEARECFKLSDMDVASKLREDKEFINNCHIQFTEIV